MEVSRLYNIHRNWYAILRLWAMETVFSKEPSIQGMRESLNRLTAQRNDIDTVITELKSELEEVEWLL